MKLGIIQFSPYLGDLDKTIKKLDSMLDEVKEADLIVLPELANSGYNFDSKEQAFELAESADNSIFLNYLIDKSKELNTYIVSGFNEKENDSIYSSSAILGSEGIIGTYRKIHLFWNERDYFTKGNLGMPVFETDIGKIGMLVCFDWIFPEIWRILALKGAEIICHPSNIVLPYAQKVVPSHALVNRIFVVTVNRTGTEGNLTFTGKSIIADPTGEVLYMASKDQEETFVTDIDMTRARNKSVTPRNDVFKDRFPKDYQELVE
jgi:predicted amidohydrolase